MVIYITCTILQLLISSSLGIEDFIYVYGEGNKDMAEQGRTHYQIIKDRGTLPKYGPCWRSVLEHLDESCRHLSEDTQSDIALHITNCFLEMSGHETYNCLLDKKPNLRGICISSMSDRAFNVYTEFYTHTQNICWFLRGQIWHETIAENTLKVGKQLEISADQQEKMLKIQMENVAIQEKMLQRGKFLEKVMEDVYVSTEAHKDILKVLMKSVSSLQAWIIGEVSWLDSIVFNLFAIFLVFILTSIPRTSLARLPLLFLLVLNFSIERLISALYIQYTEPQESHNLYNNIYSFVWYTRYAFIFIGVMIILYIIINYEDVNTKKLMLLHSIQKQNRDILTCVDKFRVTPIGASIDFIKEARGKRNSSDSEANFVMHVKDKRSDSMKRDFQSSFTKNMADIRSPRYQLRSCRRSGTPDSGVAQ